MSGHIFDMVNRINQNKISKRRKFKGNNRATLHSKKSETSTAFNFPVASKIELEKLKSRVGIAEKADRRKSLFIFVIAIAIVAFAFWAFINYYKVDSYTIAS